MFLHVFIEQVSPFYAQSAWLQYPFNWQRKASVIPAEGTQGSVFTQHHLSLSIASY
uniref:Uncharacterized protein n=1 Tax=Anguilla anguilla TaxID=7936 RepID=A0A0E9TF30_ANGAN